MVKYFEIRSKNAAKHAVTALIDGGKWFDLTPHPFDVYRIAVKDEGGLPKELTDPGFEPCDECSGTRYPVEKHEEHCSLNDDDK